MRRILAGVVTKQRRFDPLGWQVKLCDALKTRAIPERLCDGALYLCALTMTDAG